MTKLMNCNNLSLYFKVEAIKIRVLGMLADNAQRIARNDAPAYTELDFENCAREIEDNAQWLETD